MIKKIAIRNYRIFEKFDLTLQSGMNILVGNNDCGKSTLLEAVSLALTFRLQGKLVNHELNPYLFNRQAANRFLSALRDGRPATAPEITIDLFLDDALAPEILLGDNNALGEDAIGIRVRVVRNPEFDAEYQELVRNPGDIRLMPTEYYKAEWLGFSGNPITYRSIPATAHLIDASTIRLQTGTDYYLQGIINGNLNPNERVELSRSYRNLKEVFSQNAKIAEINNKLRGEKGEVTDKSLSLSLDISQRSTWESAIAPHLDDLPVGYVGKGEQNTLKILLALNRRLSPQEAQGRQKQARDVQILLIEEPENHASFSTMNILVEKIAKKCQGRQVLLTTHSSYVLNRLGLNNLVLVTPEAIMRIHDLPPSTVDYFEKLSGFDTLRVLLAKRTILVEGPSDDLIVQRAYLDKYGKLPIEDGVDVIDSRGLTAKRILDIAVQLNLKVAVVTDNDGNDPEAVRNGFDAYLKNPNIQVHVGKGVQYPTLEPQLLAANGRELLNKVFKTTHSTDQELLWYMKNNKTTCALAIFKSPERINTPDYINDAID